MNKKIADLVAWSLRYAALGIYPACGFEGEAFPNNSYRKHLGGKAIAGDYKPSRTNLAYVPFLMGILKLNTH